MISGAGHCRNKQFGEGKGIYSKQFAGKKIIILTGLNHKYYLQDKLSDPKKRDVRISEFVGE
jgi:hypothetical protein